MDVLEKADLVERPPTQEIVTRDELVDLFKTNQSPKHYIGLEISGFLHLGSLISTGFKINDFVSAGIDCTVFLADWHTLINDKLGGDRDVISKVSEYYRDAFRLVCPDAHIVMGSDLYRENPGYWSEFVGITRHMSLARTMRTLTIMGRSEDDEKIGLAKLLYPPMQAADIHALDVDIVHAGMDQRKIHMLAREVFPKMGWKVPVAVHHKLLPGLCKPAADSQPGKMSKSDSNSGIFVHDTDDMIRKKISKAWCEEGIILDNPVLEIARAVIFHGSKSMNVERPEKFGGNVSYPDYTHLEEDYAQKKLHPGDLKRAVGDCLVSIIAPIRDKLKLDGELDIAIKKSC
ncbi:MAG: tyrosine--tRNA ligase [Nitrosopumilus sp. B06]|nr:MAG: tyrosine--tRNA ligase [Nitrosopumilus sp. D6]RNJ80033.1 MAG: tyrosine--tRNA ligase [Nitrosopumilus sp. B06]